jgi:hypothetical protein
MESGSILIRPTERQKLCFPERPGVESNACGGARLGKPVNHIECRMAGQVGHAEMAAYHGAIRSAASPALVRGHQVDIDVPGSLGHPPYVGFIARLRPGPFPGSGARKLPSSTNNLLGWVLPPLVICAVEAHLRIPLFVHWRGEHRDYFRIAHYPGATH